MTGIVLLICTTLLLAYWNGANDNFKGVATLYGANVTGYRGALIITTLATFCGCIVSFLLAQGLVVAFSGRGLVPEEIAGSQTFVLSVASGACATVLLSTLLGFPISTTHSLIGALLGVGIVSAGRQLNLAVLGSIFFLPLLVSPVMAALLTIPLYRICHDLCGRLNIKRHSCICVSPGNFVPLASVMALDHGLIERPTLAPLLVSIGVTPACVQKYNGQVLGIEVQVFVDGLHYLSAVCVCFARSLNDTPKIAGLLMLAHGLDVHLSTVAIGIAMVVGGCLNSRRVAQTISKKISKMSDGQALSANIVTAVLVLFATRFGMPVSTTHVSVGSIAGIGFGNGSADYKVIGRVALAWVMTLPVAAAIGAVVYFAISCSVCK